MWGQTDRLPNKKLNPTAFTATGKKVIMVTMYSSTRIGEGITMADGFGTGGQNPQGGSDPNNTYHYNYSYGSGSGGRNGSGGDRPPQSSGSWREWAGIGVLFLIPSGICKLIALVWLLRKLGAMSSADKQRYKREARNAANQAKYAAQSFFQQAGTSAGPTERQAPPRQEQARTSGAGTYHYSYAQPRQKQQAEPWESADPAKRRRKLSRPKASGGTGLIIAGSIVSGIFGLGTVAVAIEVFRGLFHGYFWTDDFIGLLACMMFLAGGLGMLFSGIGRNRSNERYLNYLAYIGANREVALAPMAASFGVSVGKLCKDLRRMLAKGILPTGYLDLAEGKLFLTEMGYRAPEPKREAPPVQEETPQQAAAREDDILREIRQVNDAIPDEVMTAKIRRIEEITGKILKYQKEHPNREGQLRTFLNYYLPTTLKILRAYAQLDAQGIEGENISAAKKRIEDMMDQVVSGFEKQLDKLFQDDAMDITSDVEVLENMLKKDGLSDEGGITMTL